MHAANHPQNNNKNQMPLKSSSVSQDERDDD